MRKIILIALPFIMLSPLTYAAEGMPPECRLVAAHQPRADVTYTPGVDVKGKAVVPADLNAAPIPAPKVVTAPLSVQLSSRLQGMNISGVEMPAPVGFLEIYDTGRVVYDGKDLTPQVYALCGISGKVTDGQGAPDTIKSKPGNDFNNLIKETAR